MPEHLRAAMVDPEQQLYEVYPDCWRACELFQRMHTQWDMVGSMSGIFPVGLKYQVLWGMMDRLGIDKEEQRVLESDVQVMEAAWLSERAQMREEARHD